MLIVALFELGRRDSGETVAEDEDVEGHFGKILGPVYSDEIAEKGNLSRLKFKFVSQ